MSPQDLFLGQQLLAVARPMRSNLRRSRSFPANLLQMTFDLFATRARRVQILLRITFDLWLTVLSNLDLVAQPLNPYRQLGTIDAGRILLRLKQAALL